ncbi:MAG TPA: hypothetical protein VK589_20040 [Chryseolinea sp.]|nr:hypothetical protein [Chryseolinea sp.]
MLTLTNQPLYFKCYFFDKKNKKVVFIYKIESTDNPLYPFQLLKRIADGPMGWMHLSIYASVHDSLGTLLKELFTEELSDEIYRGQASIDSAAILEKLNNGERTVAIYDKTGNQAFRLEYDVAVENLVQRKVYPRLQKRSRKIGVRIG